MKQPVAGSLWPVADAAGGERSGCRTRRQSPDGVDMEASEYDSLIEQRLEADEMCAALHEAGHAMLADALDVGIECASIKELRNPNAKPPAYVRSGPCPVKFEVVIVLAGQAVDESLGADASCQRNPMMYETDEKRLEECRTKLFPDQKKETQGFLSLQPNPSQNPNRLGLEVGTRERRGDWPLRETPERKEGTSRHGTSGVPR